MCIKLYILTGTERKKIPFGYTSLYYREGICGSFQTFGANPIGISLTLILVYRNFGVTCNCGHFQWLQYNIIAATIFMNKNLHRWHLLPCYSVWLKVIPLRTFTSSLGKLNLKDNRKIESIDIKPIIKYDNADIDKVKILSDNRHKLGIYRWTNKNNGNIYVGSSINLSVRFYKYFSLGSLAKSNRPIDRALLKYGFSGFSLEILEYCERKETLLEREQYYMDNLKPEYNIVERAGSTLGYKHTEESLEKMRNFVLSEEVLAKKRLATANATASRRISILVEDIETNEKSEYASLTEAGEALGVSRAAMSQALLNNRLIKKRYNIKKKTSPA